MLDSPRAKPCQKALFQEVYYFDEPRLLTVICWLALASRVTGFENIGIVLIRKELDFAQDFRLMIYRRLLVFVITLALAL